MPRSDSFVEAVREIIRDIGSEPFTYREVKDAIFSQDEYEEWRIYIHTDTTIHQAIRDARRGSEGLDIKTVQSGNRWTPTVYKWYRGEEFEEDE